MAQYSDHFLALTVLAPAHLIVQIGNGKAQCFGGGQRVLQAAADAGAVRRVSLCRALDAGNAKILL